MRDCEVVYIFGTLISAFAFQRPRLRDNRCLVTHGKYQPYHLIRVTYISHGRRIIVRGRFRVFAVYSAVRRGEHTDGAISSVEGVVPLLLNL